MDLKQIEILSDAKGIKIKDLAIKADVAYSGLYRSIKENTIKASTLEKISEILEVPISVFFGVNLSSDNEINELRKENSDLKNHITSIEELLQHSKSITEMQKNLIDMVMKERTSLVNYMSAMDKISKANPDLKNNPGILEVVKLQSKEPVLMDSIKEILKHVPGAFEEFEANIKAITIPPKN